VPYIILYLIYPFTAPSSHPVKGYTMPYIILYLIYPFTGGQAPLPVRQCLYPRVATATQGYTARFHIPYLCGECLQGGVAGCVSPCKVHTVYAWGILQGVSPGRQPPPRRPPAVYIDGSAATRVSTASAPVKGYTLPYIILYLIYPFTARVSDVKYEPGS
jgi:hypothetical protein